MVNEFGEIDIPNMSEFLSPSSGFTAGSTTNLNSEMEMNTNLNWDSCKSYDTNQCSWPSIADLHHACKSNVSEGRTIESATTRKNNQRTELYGDASR